MRSFAIWYLPKDNKTDLDKQATVHVNLWNNDDNLRKNYYFDFGLLVENIKDIKSIYLYAPFTLEKNQIKDLGSVISSNQLVNAIFNENYTTTDGEPKRFIVNGSGEKPPFVIYSLQVENQIELRTCKRNDTTPGTIIEMKVPTISPDEILRYYFRIRIEVPKEAIKLINNEIKGVSILSNQFTNTEVIDFRLNDIRSCSEELREQFNKGCKFQLLAVHYLILRNANDIIIHHGKEINSRMLEKDLWNKYIGETKSNIIAYHMKSKAKEDNNSKKIKFIEDFSDLSRFQSKKSTKLLLLAYVLGIIVFGAFGGVLGNWISKKIGI